LEKRFFKLFDERKGIVKWASEEMYIPYVSPVDGKQHRYFIDIIAKTEKGKLIFIEIKPKTQCAPPKQKKRNTQRYIQELVTWQVNEAKWKAAQEFAHKKGGEFLVLTEEHLKNWN